MVLFQKYVRRFGPSTKMAPTWLQLAQWFLRRRFLCEFPIGPYVKLSSAVGAILIEGPNRRIHFWKRTIQWLFHQNFVFIEQMVSDKARKCPNLNCISIMMSFLTYIMGFFYELWTFDRLCKLEKEGMKLKKNLLLEENHPMTISSKFCSYWANGFRQEDFYGNFP
jgi:hypothetical protein